MRAQNGTIWTFDRFVLNPATSELTRDGTPVAIEPQSLRLLQYLVRHRDRVVAREDLIEAIWQGRAVSDWAVSAAIKALRVALGDVGKHKRFVRTVHSRGYRFVADVSSGPDSAPDPGTALTVLVRLFRHSGADRSLDPAEALARKAILLDDRAALGHARLGWVLGFRGQPEATVAAFEAAIARDPKNAEVFYAYGETMNRLARVQLARAYCEAGRQDQARDMVRHIRSIAPKYSLAHAGRMFPYPVAAERARLVDALRRAGME